MGSVVRYLDNGVACWSQVRLDSGERVWISVAQAGVLVKKSRLGLFGATLYNETNVYNAAETAKILHSDIVEYSIPPDMTNSVLVAFTQAALDCESAAKLSLYLNTVG